ncbi:MAG TPA: GAF domain-containing protein [bacterium (Candidatus Stahlbacteria)]|nr:GAF domain-containing protein [Candidatus Stahlbacteria bacterium]
MFKVLYEISQILNSTLDLDELLTRMMDLVIKYTRAERGFILTKDGIRVARNMNRETIDECLSQTVMKEVLDKNEPILTIDAKADPRFRDSESILMQQVLSICAVPLVFKGVLKGIIYVDSSTKRGIFTQNTLRFLSLFANIAAISLENALAYTTLKEDYKALKPGFGEIIGTSAKMVQIFDLIKRAAHSSCPVFIQGESGTGKELVAKAIHCNSERRKAEFVPLYCGGLPESLIESELFGYRRGAFTDAVRDKPGLFEVADTGTLFLDEICDIPLEIQAKLLRVLQNGEIRRIGETNLKKVDVRIIAATNKNVEEELKKQRFREDLYYRLNVLEIKLPPLRERREDIPLLAYHFLRKYSQKYGKGTLEFSRGALNRLCNYYWRGNVRELENLVQRIVVTVDKSPIPADAIPYEEVKEVTRTLHEAEKQIILERLREFNGNRRKAAKSLGISLRTLQYKLKKWKEN